MDGGNGHSEEEDKTTFAFQICALRSIELVSCDEAAVVWSAATQRIWANLLVVVALLLLTRDVLEALRYESSLFGIKTQWYFSFWGVLCLCFETLSFSADLKTSIIHWFFFF